MLCAIALCMFIGSAAIGEPEAGSLFKPKPKCGYCGKAIESEYVQYLNRDYHRNCFLNVVPKCIVCTEPITDEYVEDYWGNRYHARHQRECEKCTYCSRLISKNSTNGGKITSDGRHICNICFNDIPGTEGEVEGIIEGVRRLLARNGINIDMTDIPVQLVGRESLRELGVMSGSSKEMGLAHYSYKTLNGVIVERDFSIFKLDYLPRIIFEGVLAHEMMHIWAYQNCNRDLESALSEGASNYAAFLVYSDSRTKMADYMIENLRRDDDPIYGHGFRTVERYVEKRGINSLLNHMQNSSRLP